jgi:hypothetical protein
MAQSAPGRLPAGQSWPDNLFGGLADMANPPFFSLDSQGIGKFARFREEDPDPSPG